MNEVPTPTETVQRRIKQLRERRGWSQQDLADRLSRHGLPWQRQTVTKVENGKQRVSVDELVGVAFILGVSPASLLVPEESRPVGIIGDTNAPTGNVWAWITGQLQMGGGEFPGEVHSWEVLEERFRFYWSACPNTFATAEDRLPGLAALAQAVAGVRNAAGCELGMVPKVWPALLDQLSRVSVLADSVTKQVRLGVDNATGKRAKDGKK